MSLPALAKRLPRGVRENNPGNLRHGQPWWGLAEKQTDPDFCTFIKPEFGIRALAKTLQTYQKRYTLRTIEQVIRRWAPPNENDTEAYIAAVEKSTGLRRNLVLNLTTLRHAKPLVLAIINHENGKPPKGGWYSDDVVNEGLRLAGVK